MLRKRRSELVSCAPPRPVKRLVERDRHAIRGARRDVAHGGEEQTVLEDDVEDHLGLVHGGVRRHGSVSPRRRLLSTRSRDGWISRGSTLRRRWRRLPHSRADSSSRSSSGCPASARSTRSRSSSAPPSSRSAASRRTSKVWALELALRCCDLTTLEGQDTPGKVAALCSKAIRPDPSDPTIPSRRRGLRLPEPRPDREGAPRRQRRQGRERRDARSRPARARST